MGTCSSCETVCNSPGEESEEFRLDKLEHKEETGKMVGGRGHRTPSSRLKNASNNALSVELQHTGPRHKNMHDASNEFGDHMAQFDPNNFDAMDFSVMDADGQILVLKNMANPLEVRHKFNFSLHGIKSFCRDIVTTETKNNQENEGLAKLWNTKEKNLHYTLQWKGPKQHSKLQTYRVDFHLPKAFKMDKVVRLMSEPGYRRIWD